MCCHESLCAVMSHCVAVMSRCVSVMSRCVAVMSHCVVSCVAVGGVPA